MKPESSIPHSQVLATCPYPEPDRSVPCPHIPFLKCDIAYHVETNTHQTNSISF